MLSVLKYSWQRLGRMGRMGRITVLTGDLDLYADWDLDGLDGRSLLR